MKTVLFRPLRRVKKHGKVVVASYSQWYALATANYKKFQLIIVDEFTDLHPDDKVCDHNGQVLFFPNYDPYEMPEFSDVSGYSLTDHYENNLAFTYYHDGGSYRTPHLTYHGIGIDCQGTPTFSHFTVDQIAVHQTDLTIFEPLTVRIVLNWLGWFLMRLENAEIVMNK